MAQPPPPGWYPDYRDPQLERWWGGTAWTAETRPAGSASPPPPPPQAGTSYDVLPPPVVGPPDEGRHGQAVPRTLGSFLSRPLWVALIAAALTAFGTLLPWVSVLVFSVNGIQTGDGKVVLVCALLAGAFVAGSSRRPRLYLVGGGFGLVCFATSLYDLIRVFGDRSDFFDESIGASPGAGLWMALLSSGVLVGAVVKQRKDGAR